jgi:hypothetical protein
LNLQFQRFVQEAYPVQITGITDGLGLHFPGKKGMSERSFDPPLTGQREDG